LHHKQSPEKLSVEEIQDYLYFCQKQHKTPSGSFFKHTIFGLRAAYKVMGMEAKRVALPHIKQDQKLPTVLSQQEVKRLLKAPKHLKHRLICHALWLRIAQSRTLQATLAVQEIVLTLPREPLLHRQRPSCKKGTLHSVLLFDARGPLFLTALIVGTVCSLKTRTKW
jgi:hypothetical protein